MSRNTVANFLTPATKMGLSIAVATGLYGISFGALSIAAGLNLWQTVALSALMFTGGSQFAFIGVISGGGAASAAFSAASLLGIRNAVYGMQLKQTVRPHARFVPWMAQVTIDESTAVSMGQSEIGEKRRGFLVAGVGVYVFWNMFTLIGALLGERMGDPAAWGLDGAAVAAFVGLLWPRLKSLEPALIAMAAAVVTLLSVTFTAPGVPILLTAAGAAIYALLTGRRAAPATVHGPLQNIPGEERT